MISLLLVVTALAAGDQLVLEVVSVSDTHGWIYGHRHQPEIGDYGTLVSYIDHVRKQAASDPGRSVLVADVGDLTEGTGLSDATPIRGQHIYESASKVGFDFLTVGNHDLGHEETVKYIYENVQALFGGRYISTNSYLKDGDIPLSDQKYAYLTTPNGLRLLVFGFLYKSTYDSAYVTSPKTEIQSDLIQEVLRKYAGTTDILLLLSHIGTDDSNHKDIVAEFRTFYDKIGYTIPIIILSAHSHQLHNEYCTFDSTKQCFIVEAGCYLRYIQDVSYTFESIEYEYDGTICTGYKLVNANVSHPNDNQVEGLVSRLDLNLSADGSDFITARGEALREEVVSLVDELGLNAVIGYSRYNYSKKEDMSHPTSLFHLWLDGAIPSEVYNAARMLECVQVSILGSSSVRDSLYAGHIVLDDVYNIMPFSNDMMYIPYLTAYELNCVFGEYAREARSGLPRYLLSFDPSTLSSEQCYDLVLSSYDASKFSSKYTSGSCVDPNNKDKKPLTEYNPLAYPSEPHGPLTTFQILQAYIIEYMKTSGDVDDEEIYVVSSQGLPSHSLTLELLVIAVSVAWGCSILVAGILTGCILKGGHCSRQHAQASAPIVTA